MKKILLLFVLANVFVFSQSTLKEIDKINFHFIPSFTNYEDTSFIPLQNNNSYQYILSGYGGGTVYSYLRYGTISNDTLINNHEYYLHTIRGVSHWLRYSEEDHKLYKWQNESDLVYMDYNKEPGDTFIHLDYPIPATVLGGDTSIFSMSIPYKGFSVPIPSAIRRELFAKGIGLYYSRSESTSIINSSNSTYSLIMSILYDSAGNVNHFTNHIKPVITVTPVTLINTSNFNLNFTVSHQYNRIYPPGHISMIFIDSVKFESYYSKQDSIIELPAYNFLYYSTTYNVATHLDTMLLKNGFTFNYRIVAKDKGIIPETSYSPDTGYYQCVWDFSTTVGNETQPVSEFALHQNYPNPFNPSTKISWQSPVGSWQTIKVFDVLGSDVATLVDEYRNAGYHEVEFNVSSGIRDLASGIYFYQLQAGSFIETKKMMVIR